MLLGAERPVVDESAERALPHGRVEAEGRHDDRLDPGAEVEDHRAVVRGGDREPLATEVDPVMGQMLTNLMGNTMGSYGQHSARNAVSPGCRRG